MIVDTVLEDDYLVYRNNEKKQILKTVFQVKVRGKSLVKFILMAFSIYILSY